MDARDISETAFRLPARHGDAAPIFAGMEFEPALETGELDGAAN